MHVCILTFRLRAGVGPQSVTDVVDQDGVPFTPEYLFAINGSSVAETLASVPLGPDTTAACNTNVTNLLTGESGYSGSANAWSGAGVSIRQSASGTGQGPSAGICSLSARAPGGHLDRTVQITAVYSGGFDLNVLTNDDPAPVDILVILFAGDSGDFQMAFLAAGASATIPTPFPAKGLLNPKTMAPAATGAVSTATGGLAGWGWGWDTPNGGPQSIHAYLGGTLGSGSHSPSRYQSLVSPDSVITIVPAEVWPNDQIKTDNPWVTSWDAASLTFAAPPDPNRRGWIIGGPRVVTASGRATQQPGTGAQVIPTGILPIVVFLAACGSGSNPNIQVGAECSIGFGAAGTAGVRQGAYWVGETSDVRPLTGARYLSGSSILRLTYFGSNGSFTVFSSVASLAGIDAVTGAFTLNWTANDNIPRELLWFAIGLAPVIPVPIPPTPPPPPGTPAVRSWRLHRYDVRPRGEGTA